MAYPQDYAKTTNFTEYAGNNPASPYNPPDHDQEFDNIQVTLETVVSLIKRLTRADGELANNVVKPEALSTVALAVVTTGWKPRGMWATGVDYVVGDLIEGAASISFVCAENHTSAANIDIDRGYGRWVCIGNGSSAAVNDIINYATEAITARNEAETFKNQAQAAVVDAEEQAVLAEGRANAAGANAVSANSSAIAAAASASSAESSAIAAAAAASSTTPVAEQIHAATAKTTPVDADEFGIADSAASWWIKKITLANLKAAFNALYMAIVAPGTSGNVLTSNGSAWTSAAPVVPDSVPAGTVAFVAKNTAPSGYLKANGSAVSRTAYAALFTAIGTTFGVGDGSTTFNLPDLRGEFLRGWDDGRGIDAGRGIGTAQSGEIESHKHLIDDPTNAYGSGTALYNANYSRTINQTGRYSGATGGAETRPRNVALLACIKY